MNNFQRFRYYPLSFIRDALFCIVLFGGLYFLGRFLPVGYDWEHFFSIGVYPSIWTPWTKPIVDHLNLPAVFAITLFAITIRTYKLHGSAISLGLAVLSLPTMWVLFLGNLDGLVLLGLLLLPWGVPLVLIKPQLSAFALLARKSSIYMAIVWVGISLLIWGLWPLNFLTVLQPGWRAEWANDISLFPWGVLIALPLIWISRKDEDLLMAAGSFMTPHLFPYHFILLMPALARMNKKWMFATWALTWTPLLSNWLGPWAWHFGNLVSVAFWIGIYSNLPDEKKVPLNKMLPLKYFMHLSKDNGIEPVSRSTLNKQ